MSDIREQAAEAADDLIGSIHEHQLAIARETIEERTDRTFESLEEVERDLHLFFDFDEIPDEYRALDDIKGRLDAAYHRLLGEDLAGDEERYSTDPTPSDDQAQRFRERLTEIDTDRLIDLDDTEIENLETALAILQD